MNPARLVGTYLRHEESLGRLDVRALAAHMGVTLPAVYAWARGENYVSLEKMDRLAQFFG
jgi:transcriptional regulator with XRE-family HTH domain